MNFHGDHSGCLTPRAQRPQRFFVLCVLRALRVRNCFLLAALLVSGCVHFKSLPLMPEKSAAQLEARRLDDAGLKKFLAENSDGALEIWPLEKWNLNSLTLAAFYFHPDLAVARAQWQLAEAGVKSAGGRPNPTLALTPQYNTTTLTPTPWAPGVNFDLPIETAGKRTKRMAEAGKISESARWNFISAAWQIRGGVRSALAEFSIAERRRPLLEMQLESLHAPNSRRRRWL
jgi:outer membrane protein, heavy metal efflux system